MALKPKKKPTKSKGKTTKSKAKKPAGRKATYKAGQTVEFRGYVDNQDDPIFEEGEVLSLTKVSKVKGEVRIEAVRLSDREKYDQDPDSVDGDELLSSEVKKVKASVPAVVKPEPPLVDVGQLPELLKKHKGNILVTAHDLLEEVSKNFFYFGGLMAHAHRQKVFVKDEGFEDSKKGFYEFCKSEFNMDGRKVYTWIDIYLTFSNLPKFSEKKLAGIGWSKAAELAKYATDENVDELVTLAKEKPITELQATLREEYVTEGRTSSGREARSVSGGTIKRIAFAFKLFEDQADGVRLAIESACKTLGMDENQAFEHIVMEWASEHLTEKQAKAAKRAKGKKARQLKKDGVKVPTDEERLAA